MRSDLNFSRNTDQKVIATPTDPIDGRYTLTITRI